MFNSLKYAKQLEQAGVSRRQAETYLQILGEVMEKNLASQQDVKDLKQSVAHDMQEFRLAMTRDMQEFKQSMTRDMQEFKQSMGHDMQDFKQAIAHDMKEFKQSVHQDIHDLKQTIEHRFIQQEQRMTIKLGTIVSIAIGVAVTLAKVVS